MASRRGLSDALGAMRDGLQFDAPKQRLYRFDAERRHIVVLNRDPCSAWVKSAEHPWWRGWSPPLNITALTRLSARSLAAGRIPIENVPWVDPNTTATATATATDHDANTDTAHYAHADHGTVTAHGTDTDSVGDIDDLISRARARRRLMTWRQFFALFPPQILGLTGRYRRVSHQWDLLTALVRVPQAADIAADNPALFCALAFNRLFRGLPGRADRLQWLRRHIARRRSRIVADLGFAADPGFAGMPSVVRVLSRMPAEFCDPGTLLALRSVLRTKAGKPLHHAEVLSPSAVRIVATDNSLLRCTPGFVLDPALVAADRARHLGPWALARDIQRIGVFLGLGTGTLHVDSYRALVARSHDLHRDLDRYLRRVAPTDRSGELCPEIPDIALPLPPIPGNAEVQPLTSARELFIEGLVMHHCVYTYLPEILAAAGDLAAYRVLKPARFTITVRRHAGVCRLAQAHAVANAPVPEAALRPVRQWLAAGGSSVGSW